MPPTKRPSTRIALTPEMIAQLRAHIDRTGIGPTRLLRRRDDLPKGLSYLMVDHWVNGQTTSADPAHFDWALALWKSVPDTPRLPLTLAMSEAMNAEFKRTGMGPALFIRQRASLPEDLNKRLIGQWLERSVKSVDARLWNAVMNRLSNLPTSRDPCRSRYNREKVQIEIPLSSLAELRAHRERSGISSTTLLKDAQDAPVGLTPKMIANWLSGGTKAAQPEHIAYVLALYRAWP